ncbi:hypothetical protein DVJ78_02140 [Humibacter sp. BT305]|nr:hypothetical protein DVJ78_02140 [Humibacter sp. BT305]
MPEQMSPDYAAAFRAAYIDHMRHDRRPSRSARTWILGSMIAAVVIGGGSAAAVATGILPLPGADSVTTVADATTGTFTGPADIDMGPAPAGATNIALSLQCLSSGTLVFPDGASVHCSAGEWSGYTIPLPEATRIHLDATSDLQWSVTATYVHSDTTAWGVNEHGQTFGVVNENGTPDLVAVIATNGRQGYAYSSDLDDVTNLPTNPDDAAGYHPEPRDIPVYERDGTTKIGDFVTTPGTAR